MATRRIRELIDSGFAVHERDGTARPLCASDVVILMRSPKARAAVYREALAAYGLSAQTEESAGLLETAEVGTLVSLLSVIDNPRQDVALIGVLRSPLFGFSEEELARIRLTDRARCCDAAVGQAFETLERVMCSGMSSEEQQTLRRLLDLAADNLRTTQELEVSDL